MKKLDKLIKLLYNLVKTCFYGEVLIKFENGDIVICKRTESIKL